jgi:hypothetical protein
VSSSILLQQFLVFKHFLGIVLQKFCFMLLEINPTEDDDFVTHLPNALLSLSENHARSYSNRQGG